MPARRAGAPVKTTIFQTGRPSGMSYTRLAARMNTATYPEADHTARTTPTTAMIDPIPALFCNCETAAVMMSRAEPGVNCSRLFSSESVVDLPVRPSRDTRTSRAGNSDNSP